MIYNTRIAPSPTGDMHLGTARTAYFNWLAARATGGKFILRIDDTDKSRNSQRSMNDIVDIMLWLGLNFDGHIWYQSERKISYLDDAEKLVGMGIAKYGGDAIRLDLDNAPANYIKFWPDAIAGDIAITQSDYDQTKDLVLIKSDGMATYNWASFRDDVDLDINYVIRGVDHLKNTSKQAFLYGLYGIPQPKYAHVGMLTNFSGKKLSKRDGAASMLSYKDSGYDPDAILNFMLRLGWGPTVDDKTTKILTKDKALELFLDYGKMKNSPAKVDMQKLKSFDRKYKGRKKNGQL